MSGGQGRRGFPVIHCFRQARFDPAQVVRQEVLHVGDAIRHALVAAVGIGCTTEISAAATAGMSGTSSSF